MYCPKCGAVLEADGVCAFCVAAPRRRGWRVAWLVLGVLVFGIGAGWFANRALWKMRVSRLTPAQIDAAFTRGDVKTMRHVLEFLPEYVNKFDARGETLLQRAARTRNTKMAALLIAQRADLNVLGHNGQPPLHLAAANGATDIAILLLDHGAELKITNRQHAIPFETAIIHHQLPMIKLLLSRGMTIKSRMGHACTPLHLAARWGYPEGVRYFLAQGAVVNSASTFGMTPLHLAAGGDQGLSTFHGVTPQSDAAYLEVITLLLKHGADINAEEQDGTTPLMEAKLNHHDTIAQYLAAHGGKVKPRRHQPILIPLFRTRRPDTAG